MAIVDLEMPVMDGMEFIKWIKEINPNYPFAIVTAVASNVSPKEILDVIAYAFLTRISA
jgi:CheY-like chemotaxis protein